MTVTRDRMPAAPQGAGVVSMWHDDQQDDLQLGADALNRDPGLVWRRARCDPLDLYGADTLVALARRPGGEGGHHVEFDEEGAAGRGVPSGGRQMIWQLSYRADVGSHLAAGRFSPVRPHERRAGGVQAHSRGHAGPPPAHRIPTRTPGGGMSLLVECGGWCWR